MAAFERRRRTGDSIPGVPRRDRQECTYDAYRPDRLSGRRIMLDGGVASDVADAEQALVRLDLAARALVDTEAPGRLVLRAESVASSRSEKLGVGPRRLLRAKTARHEGDRVDDVTATEILANIDATAWAVNCTSLNASLGLDDLLDVHRRLLSGGPLA